ncbi:MAG: HEAT repeat domain-containing protein [Bdellovibrionota bacterium]
MSFSRTKQGLILAAILFTQGSIPALARMPPGGVVRFSSPNACEEFFASLENRTAHTPELQVAESKVTPLAEDELTEFVIPDNVRVLESSLPEDSDSLRRQAGELFDMRAAVSDRGEIKDAKLNERYQALEWRNSRMGLIPNDPAGSAFLSGVAEFETKTKEDKLAWLKHFASSKHVDAKSKLLRLMYREPNFELRNLLRDAAVSRGYPVNYKKTLPEIIRQLKAPASANVEVAARFRSELRDMPEELLASALSHESVEVRRRAAEGFLGRDVNFVAQYLKSEDPEIRLAAVRGLTDRILPEALTALKRGLKDPDRRVRALAAVAVGRFQDEDATKLLLPLLKDEDNMVKRAARMHWTERVQAGATPAPTPRVIRKGVLPEHPDDSTVLNGVLSEDPIESREYTRFLPGRPAKVLLQSLKANDPYARIRVIQSLENRLGAEDTKVLIKALQDPVTEVRAEVVKTLGQTTRLNREIRLLLEKTGNIDPDAEIRSLARSKLMASSENGIAYRLPDQEEAAKFAEALRHHYGNPPIHENDIHALAAATHVYTAPEAESAFSAQMLVDQHKTFLDTTPLGYRVDAVVTDPKSGLKAAFYIPKVDSKRPAVLALGGTQTFGDLLVDVNLGVLQAQSPAYAEMLKKAVEAMPNWKGELVITGHSLGGGLAQVFGHDLTAALLASGNKEAASRVRVVSWNGFGGQNPLKRMGRYSSDVAKEMKVTNYYVPNDPVSRIGTHIGEMVRLPSLDFFKLNIANRIKIHGTDSVAEALVAKNGVANGEKLAPELKFNILTAISRIMGPVADKVQTLRYKRKELEILERLGEARVLWAREEGYKHLNPRYDWLDSEMTHALNDIKDDSVKKEKLNFTTWLDRTRKEEMAIRQRTVTPKTAPVESILEIEGPHIAPPMNSGINFSPAMSSMAP